jgi:hypothetical protein
LLALFPLPREWAIRIAALVILVGRVAAAMTTSKEQGGAIFVRGLDEDEPGEHGDEAAS